MVLFLKKLTPVPFVIELRPSEGAELSNPLETF